MGVEAEGLVVIDRGHDKAHQEYYDQHLDKAPIRYLFPCFPVWARRLNCRFPGMSFFSMHHVMSGLFAHRAIGEREFDVLIACCQYSTFAARNLKRRRGIPFLTLVWDPSTFMARKIYKERFGWKYPFLYAAAAWLDRYALARCEAVITSGHFHHAHLRRLTTKPLEVLYPACFSVDRLPDFSQRERRIVAWDRWDIGNDPRVFVNLLTELEDRRIQLTIGGFWHPASMQMSFLTELDRRGLRNRVEVLGPLDEKAITALCSRAMLHVHPIHEAFGMQTLEAAGCGCPGVIPAGSGVAELFEDGVSGFHPPPGDRGALVDCANRFFRDAALARRMSESCWRVARDRTWKRYALDLKAIAERYV